MSDSFWARSPAATSRTFSRSDRFHLCPKLFELRKGLDRALLNQVLVRLERVHLGQQRRMLAARRRVVHPLTRLRNPILEPLHLGLVVVRGRLELAYLPLDRAKPLGDLRELTLLLTQKHLRTTETALEAVQLLINPMQSKQLCRIAHPVLRSRHKQE